MTIEEKIFRKTKPSVKRLEEYGFQKKGASYFYSKPILEDSFEIEVKVGPLGLPEGRVYDSFSEEEYVAYRIQGADGTFVGKIRNEFISLLKDIRDHCFARTPFQFDQTNRIAEQIRARYGEEPEFPWENRPGHGVFRNRNTKKWFSIVMNIDRSKLDKGKSGEVEIINLKLRPDQVKEALARDGFYPAYHMNKKNWVSIVLDGTLSDESIMDLIERSHFFTV